MKVVDVVAESHFMSSKYFEMFDLPMSCYIDMGRLEANYLQFQENFHPDKLVNASSFDKMQAASKIAFINQAYQTLKDELTRIAYIAKGFGTDIASENLIKPSNTLLEKIFFLSEEIEKSSQKILPDIEKELENILQMLETYLKEEKKDEFITLAIEHRYLLKLLSNYKTKYSENVI